MCGQGVSVCRYEDKRLILYRRIGTCVHRWSVARLVMGVMSGWETG